MNTLDRMLGAVRARVRATPSHRRPLDEAALHERHGMAAEAVAAAQRAAERLEPLAAEHQGSLAVTADTVRLVAALGEDIRAASDQTRESIERARLIALNAGLEGARVGEPTGKALLAFGEEARGLLARALEAVEEQHSLLSQLQTEHGRLRDQLEHAHRRSADLGDQLAAAAAARAQVDAALERVTGTDPETARALAAAARHARGLFEALSALSAHSRGRMLSRALGPSLEPIRRLLRDLGSETDESNQP
jgi:ABC-type transporter Mla subunit MlaD